jgi:AcrR family transcriptional regulator
MTEPAPQPTRTAIMDAAERLMAEHGLDGVSIRAILAEAGANSAALHYHFGSRDNLVEAVLARRGKPMNLHRREMLDALQARDRTPNVADIVAAVVDPAVELIRREGAAGRSFIRFLARLQLDRASIHQELEDRHFPDIRSRIGRMLRVAMAPLPREEVERRATMMLDAMLHSLANAGVLAGEPDASGQPDALGDYAESLKSFLTGGLAAPPRVKSRNPASK